MIWRPAFHNFIVQMADALTTLVSFWLAYHLWSLVIRLWPVLLNGGMVSFDHAYFMIMMASAIIWVLIFRSQGAYSYQRFTSFVTEIKIIGKTVFAGVLILIALLFVFRTVYFPRTLVVLFLVVNFSLLTMEKLLLFVIAKVVRERGKNRKIVLVVGTGDQTRRFVEAIGEHFAWGLDIVGFLGPAREDVGQEIFGKKILGTFDDIVGVMHTHHLDEVIITVSTRRMEVIRQVLDTCEREGVQVRIISDFLGSIAKRFRADVIYELPIISISYIPKNPLALTIKRAMDIGISLAGLIVLAPFFLIVAAAVKITSPGPVFYEWNVVGFNKRPFKSWKFRTMVVGADKMKAQLEHLNEMQGPVFKVKHDPRITPLGRFLRKFSIDELPQLWSVLKGDMSLVGPRPAGPHELVHYESWQRRKLSFKPGLTCLWQVNGRNRIHKFDDWVKMDLAYIDNWSLSLDMRILGKTILTVIRGTGT